MDYAPPALYEVMEAELISERDYANALWDVTVIVTFTAPSGAERAVDAFWDGGRTWRVRFSPDEAGSWRWRSECSDEDNAGLHGREGEFTCAEYSGDNPVYGHGPLRIAGDHTHLEYADGTPFFWLGDTAWNGVLRARDEDWDDYLALRREQGFTAIQFVCTQWRGWPEGNVFIEGEQVGVNPDTFQAMDARVAAINRHGLVAIPVLLWALQETDPGEALSEENAIRLARYMVARWGAFQVVWMLGGDGRYPDPERWRRIGRAVFPGERDRLVTLHVCGSKWVKDEFGAEPWFDFITYQSGHGHPTKTSEWITAGPPAQHWADDPLMPVLNSEPNYEGHPAYGGGYTINDHDVRRAAYFSLLVTPPAGVTYGNNHIWSWNSEPGPAPGHPNLGTVGPWSEGLRMPGIANMSALRKLMDEIEWWRLRPAQELLAEQPGAEDRTLFIAVAATPERDLVMAYTPGGLPVRLVAGELPARARWFDPRDGAWRDAVGDDGLFVCPDERDWVLVLEG
ncbi:MAG: DUF4038 domain-containing protein [Armatimonadetes bacterium]|nr:DUF4038 domain-containing protein [Armatimonadota bacterium]